jgi:hypothetical protein
VQSVDGGQRGPEGELISCKKRRVQNTNRKQASQRCWAKTWAAKSHHKEDVLGGLTPMILA